MSFRYSANIGFLWDELALPARIGAAAKAGFDAVECHFPYAHDASEIAFVLESAQLPMVGLNTALGPQGSFGLASIPNRESEAHKLIEQAVEYAVAINAQNINVVAGLSKDQSKADSVYKHNLRFACDLAASHGKTIVIEPLNPRAVPGYHFHTVEHAIEIIESVNCNNLKLMFDFFHAQIVQGDLENLIKQYASYFGHVQISAVHDRGEPDIGEINYPYILAVLESTGYQGYIGAEYKPRSGCVESGLTWLKQFRSE